MTCEYKSRCFSCCSNESINISEGRLRESSRLRESVKKGLHYPYHRVYEKLPRVLFKLINSINAITIVTVKQKN